MIRATIFIIVTALFVYISRRSLVRVHSHGFWRFFALESILALVLLNALQWFNDPFSWQQLISWFLLLISIFLAAQGVHLLRVFGKPNQKRSGDDLFEFEKTTSLVNVGVYKYIRHPLYSSLLFFTWGAIFKHLSWIGFILAFFASFFLLFTAKKDESECLAHFGKTYEIYMRGTKRFVPFLF